jgi:hypothetical protein
VAGLRFDTVEPMQPGEPVVPADLIEDPSTEA